MIKNYALALLTGLSCYFSGISQTPWINEIHYDDFSTDTNEAFEIIGPAGTNLASWTVVLYNGGTNTLYDTISLSGVITDQQNGYGTINFILPTNGLQNGSPDGIALVNGSGGVIQFLSYEGVFTATDGPAAGLTSEDIGVTESNTTPDGQSLQLTGTGCVYSDFTWAVAAPNTYDAINTGQTINCAPGAPFLNVTPTNISGFNYTEGGTSNEQNFTVTASNLTGGITVSTPLNWESSTTSGGPYQTTDITLPASGGTVYTRMISGLLAINSPFSGSFNITTIPADGPLSANVTVDGTVTAAAGTSDIISVVGSEAATISSLENDPPPLTSTDGVQVWQFDLRDGGGAPDGDTLNTILTDLVITQGTGNQVTTWTDAIQTVALFDGATFIATGTVSSNQISFNGLNVVALDDSFTRLSLRLSVVCPLGADAFDNEDFVFRITNANTTLDPSGSGKATFSQQNSLNNENRLDIAYTEMRFTAQPVSTGTGTPMTDVILSVTDGCGNIDTDFTDPVTLTTTGTMTGDPLTVAAVNGSATFTNIIHTVQGTNFIMTASTASLLLDTFSSFYDITTVTELEPGDLAVLAVNRNVVGGADQIAIVCFVDLLPSTAIYITDNGYERRFADVWGGTEGVIRITRTGSTLPKGTIIVIEANTANIFNGSHYDVYTCGAIDTNWTKWAQGGSGVGGFNVNPDDDLYFMQGGIWTNDTGHMSTYSGNVLYAWTESGWDAAPGGPSGDPTDSTLYPGLECFNTVAPGGDAFLKFNDPVDPDFSTLTNGRLDWIALINESSNWDIYTDNADYNSGGYDFKGNTNCPAITIAANPYVNGRWSGKVDNDWFNCNNWDTLVVPDETTDVLVDDNTSDREASIDIGSPYASFYGGVAKARDLNITDERVELVGGISNKLEVHGDILINGGELDMDDPSDGGELTLFGDWIRNISAGGGTFNEGNGTVIFSGAVGQSIVFTGGPLPPISTEHFFNLTLDNNFNTNTNNDLYMSGDLNITPGHTLTVSSGDYAHVANQVVNNGTFNIENNGSLVQVNNVTNSGNLSVKREISSISNYDYLYWSSPVANFNIDGIYSGFGSSPPYKYYWDPIATNANGTEGNWIDASGLDMEIGKGYIVRDPTFSFSPTEIVDFNNGVPHNGTINVQVRRGTDGSSVDDNWNLLGNPYPSSIDAIDFLLDNNSVIDGFVYLWRHLNNPLTSNPDPFYQDFVYNYDPDDYISYNSTGTSDPIGFNGYIATGQSFFVSMLESGNATQNVTFNNTLRDIFYDNSQFYSPNPLNNVIFGESADENSSNYSSKHRIWLDLISSDENVDRILVGYVSGATMDRDHMFDAITTLDNTQNFYSLIDDEIFVIQGRGFPFMDTDKIPLGMNIESPGQYHIGLVHVDGLFENEDQPIYLRDSYNNFIHDLRQSPYVFYSDAGLINDRFNIVYINETLDLDEADLSPQNLFIYEDENGHFNLRVNESFRISIVEVYDLLGRKVLSSSDLMSSYARLNTSELSQSTYVVKVELDSGAMLVRKVVKRN